MAEETKDVAEVNENSSVTELLEAEEKQFNEAQAAEPGAPSAQDTEQPENSGDEEKAQTGKEPTEEQLLETKQSIPYQRFKKVIDERNTARRELEEAAGETTADPLFSNPKVVRYALEQQGYNEAAIKQYFEDNELPYTAPLQAKKSTQEIQAELTQGLDLTTQEGWDKYIDRKVEMRLKEALNPFEQKLSLAQQETQRRQMNEWMSKQQADAEKLCKENYGIKFGEIGKDEANLNTAVGIIVSYLKKNPEDAPLGYVKLLRLAMADKGVKVGERLGEQKAEERNTIKKAAAAETEGAKGTEEVPNETWTEGQLLEYARKHPDRI